MAKHKLTTSRAVSISFSSVIAIGGVVRSAGQFGVPKIKPTNFVARKRSVPRIRMPIISESLMGEHWSYRNKRKPRLQNEAHVFVAVSAAFCVSPALFCAEFLGVSCECFFACLSAIGFSGNEFSSTRILRCIPYRHRKIATIWVISPFGFMAL